MYSLKVNKSEKITIQETQEQLISVEFNIVSTDAEDNETVVSTQAHGFALDKSDEEIKESLKKVLDTYASDSARIEELKKVEEVNKETDETIAKLADIEIKQS